MKDLLSEIVRNSGLHQSRIFNVTVFGSRVYGTFGHNSDWDVIMVANNSVESTEIRRGLFNIHIYTPDKFKTDLDWHRMNNLECLFAPNEFKLKEDIKWNLDFNSSKLRHATSHISSNSWVKAKKKLDMGEYNIAIKSLFHSIRIPMFATQILNSGSIFDFNCANLIWREISSRDNWTWDELDSNFRGVRNSVMSEFRLLC